MSLEYAADLLEERDPVRVVATLLELSEPELPCQPVELSPPPPPRPPRYAKHSGSHGNKPFAPRGDHQGRGPTRGARRNASKSRPRRTPAGRG